MADLLSRLDGLNTGLDSTRKSIKSMKSPQEIPGAENPEDPFADLDMNLGGEDTPEMPSLGNGEAGEEEPIQEEPPPESDADPELDNVAEPALDTPSDISTSDTGLADAPKPPKKRKWDPVTPLDNDMKSISFKSDKEGILLDIKRLDAIPNMWIARLYKGDNLLDYGQVIIPKRIKDPITYIIELANAMLDNKSMRYEQEWQQYYAAQREAKEKEEEAAQSPEPPPEEAGLEGGAEELMGAEGAPENEPVPEEGAPEEAQGALGENGVDLGDTENEVPQEQPAGNEEAAPAGEEDIDAILDSI